MSMKGLIQAGVRIRPCDTDRRAVLLSVDDQAKTVKLGQHTFPLDAVWGENSTQEHVYESCIPIVEAAIKGMNATIFTYGQTNSGKTHTMQGTEEEIGIIPRVIAQVFEKNESIQAVSMSYLELYNENVRDLLDLNVPVSKFSSFSPTKNRRESNIGLEVRENSSKEFFVPKLTLQTINTAEHAISTFWQGNHLRKVSSTEFNLYSSRSHTILTLYLTLLIDGKPLSSQINLVDLAGSEKVASSHSDVQIRETQTINQSLVALGSVIEKLGKGEQTHVNFRDSKLTKLLKASMSGFSAVLLIACISPSLLCTDESITTLRFACRAKKVSWTAKSVIDGGINPVAELQQEVLRLRNLLYLPSIKEALRDYLTSSYSVEENLLNLSQQFDTVESLISPINRYSNDIKSPMISPNSSFLSSNTPRTRSNSISKLGSVFESFSPPSKFMKHSGSITSPSLPKAVKSLGISKSQPILVKDTNPFSLTLEDSNDKFPLDFSVDVAKNHRVSSLFNPKSCDTVLVESKLNLELVKYSVDVFTQTLETNLFLPVVEDKFYCTIGNQTLQNELCSSFFQTEVVLMNYVVIDSSVNTDSVVTSNFSTNTEVRYLADAAIQTLYEMEDQFSQTEIMGQFTVSETTTNDSDNIEFCTDKARRELSINNVSVQTCSFSINTFHIATQSTANLSDVFVQTDLNLDTLRSIEDLFLDAEVQKNKIKSASNLVTTIDSSNQTDIPENVCHYITPKQDFKSQIQWKTCCACIESSKNYSDFSCYFFPLSVPKITQTDFRSHLNTRNYFDVSTSTDEFPICSLNTFDTSNFVSNISVSTLSNDCSFSLTPDDDTFIEVIFSSIQKSVDFLLALPEFSGFLTDKNNCEKIMDDALSSDCNFSVKLILKNLLIFILVFYVLFPCDY